MRNNKITIDQLNKFAENTLVSNLGIEVIEIGDDFLIGKMPVDHRTVQPFRILHGGASVALAESLGSFMANILVENPLTHQCVGLEINANHVRGVKEGKWVYGKCVALHVGRSTMVLEIKITNEEHKLVCISRLTIAVVKIE